MTPIDVLDDIIARLEPEDVPAEYIVMAKITDFEGNERIIKGTELEEMVKHPERYQIAEARVSYGGKGQLTQVQKTPAGQALVAQYSPF